MELFLSEMVIRGNMLMDVQKILELEIIILFGFLAANRGGDDGYDIFKWTGTGWQKLGRGGRRISVSPGGVPWVVVVGRKDNIWRFYNVEP
jgi:hypothetical protein